MLEGRSLQASSHAAAEVFDVGDQTSQFFLLISLIGQLLGLILQGEAALFKILAPTLIFGEWNHAGEIGFCQAVELLLQTGTATTQVFKAGLEFLRQPLSALGALHGLSDHFGMHE